MQLDHIFLVRMVYLLPERRGGALLNFQIYAFIYGNNPYMGKSLRSGAAMPEV